MMPLLSASKPLARSTSDSAMVTMRQVAREAGVSYTTVSFVINGNDTSRGIGAATRERVLQTAKRLGYRHNGLARAVSTGRSRVLAVAVQSLEFEFRARVLEGVLEAAEAANYFVKLVALTDNTISDEKIEQLVQARVAGVVAVDLDDDSLARLRAEVGRYGGLVAIVDDVSPQAAGIRVSSDDAGGVRAAFEHLHGLGHRRIALLSGPVRSFLARERRQAFAQLIARHDLHAFPVVHTNESWMFTEDKEAQLQALLAAPDRPTAVLCMSDLMAMHTVRVARRLKLDVPRDLSVVGYGDFNIAIYADPSLTSVNQPFHQMGHGATIQLLRALEAELGAAPDLEAKGDSPLDFAQVLPVTLMVRESSGPAPTRSA